MSKQTERDAFRSRWGFILACIGSAVGMGNIWRFPYLVSAWGGMTFLLPYFLFVLLIGSTGIIGEMALGRSTRSGPIGAFGQAAALRGRRSTGEAVGYIPVLGSLALAIGYSCVVGWIFKYFALALDGGLFAMGQDMNVIVDRFNGTACGWGNNFWLVIALAVNFAIMAFGVGGGIERANKVMMPVLFFLFAGLGVYIATLPGAGDGYRYIFTLDPAGLADPKLWIYAFGQAFFSLSVTGSGMIAYGSYLDRKEDVIAVSRHTAIFDTIAALVAALVIIPACFSYDVSVDAGPSLLFITLPSILQDIPLGQVFAIILYAAMIFAGVSSLQNMFEAVAESLLHRFPKLRRTVALGIICVICLGAGIGMEAITRWGIWMDLVSIYIIPIGATLGAISWFWIMKKSDLFAAINEGGRKPRGKLWYFLGRYLYVPIAIILCVIALAMKVAF